MVFAPPNLIGCIFLTSWESMNLVIKSQVDYYTEFSFKYILVFSMKFINILHTFKNNQKHLNFKLNIENAIS